MTKLELRVLYIEARNASNTANHAAKAAYQATGLFYNAFQDFIGNPTDEEFAELHKEDKADLLARLSAAMLEGFANLAEAHQMANEEPEDEEEPISSEGPSLSELIASLKKPEERAGSGIFHAEDLTVKFVREIGGSTEGVVMSVRVDKKTKLIHKPLLVMTNDGPQRIAPEDITPESMAKLLETCLAMTPEGEG